MKRKIGLICLLFFILLSGCSNNKALSLTSTNQEHKPDYDQYILLEAELPNTDINKGKSILVKPMTLTKEDILFTIKSIVSYSDEIIIDKLPTQGEIELDNGSSLFYSFYENYIYLQECPQGIIQLEDWIKAGDAYPGEPKDTTLSHVIISQDSAIEQAQAIIRHLNVKDLSVSYVSKARILLPSFETYSEGWFIAFGNCFDPLYSPIYISSVLPNNRMNVKSQETAPWLPETMTFFIDETGIKAFQWADPVIIVEGSEAMINLLPIPKIYERITSYFQENCMWDYVISDADIPTIENIVLTNVLIKKQPNSVDEGKIQPAWAVYYTTAREKANYSLPSIVFFDAASGNIIDPFTLDDNAYQQ